MSEADAATAPPPDGRAGSTMLEKAWAVAGLIGAVALAWMAIDLIRGPQQLTPPGEADGGEQGT